MGMKQEQRAKFHAELEKLGVVEVQARVIRGTSWNAYLNNEAAAWLAAREHKAKGRIYVWTIVGAVAACAAAALGLVALLL